MADPPVLDLHSPAASRMHSYWLGGHDHYRCDRDRAAAIGRICPAAGEMARDSREFTARAVTWAARQGITQFIDLGCGFLAAREFWDVKHPGDPRLSAGRAPEDIHATARAVNPGARVAYVDHDLQVTRHGLLIESARVGASRSSTRTYATPRRSWRTRGCEQSSTWRSRCA